VFTPAAIVLWEVDVRCIGHIIHLGRPLHWLPRFGIGARQNTFRGTFEPYKLAYVKTNDHNDPASPCVENGAVAWSYRVMSPTVYRSNIIHDDNILLIKEFCQGHRLGALPIEQLLVCLLGETRSENSTTLMIAGPTANDSSLELRIIRGRKRSRPCWTLILGSHDRHEVAHISESIRNALFTTRKTLHPAIAD
jgi:hypothetical protein